jgi:hypothetical protein
VIWAEKKNGTTGPVGAQILSMSQLLGRKWNSEKAIATGTHNKPAPPDVGGACLAYRPTYKSLCIDKSSKQTGNLPGGM